MRAGIADKRACRPRACGIAKMSGMSSLSRRPGLDADRRHQHQLAKPLRRLARHLGGDPAADRTGDQVDLRDVEPIEQLEIDVGDVVDAIEPFRQARFAEARMRRRDHAGALPPAATKRLPGIVTLAAMQKQNRAAMIRAAIHCKQLEIDAGNLHRCRTHASSSHPPVVDGSPTLIALSTFCHARGECRGLSPSARADAGLCKLRGIALRN